MGLVLRSSEKEVFHQNNSNLELFIQVQFLPKSAASLCAQAGHCLVSSPILFLAGHSFTGCSPHPGWCQGQHGAGAGGGGAAALEAAGAGAEEDCVRPAQDAELGPAGLCHIRTPQCWNGTSNPPRFTISRGSSSPKGFSGCVPCPSPAQPRWPLGYGCHVELG